MYSKFDQMNLQSSTYGVPPPRPPKSPALMRKEYERMEGGDMGDELLRLEVLDDQSYPQRHPKPDRFKSPQHGFNYNNSSNKNDNHHHNKITCDEVGVMTADARLESKHGEVANYMPVPERRSLRQDNSRPTAAEIVSSDINVGPKGKAGQKSSFELLHESFNPRNIKKEDKFNLNDNSYELLANSGSPNLPTTEYATYVNPQLLRKKHSKLKSAQNIPNPNYEDSILPIMILSQNEASSNATVDEANSRLLCRNASKSNKQDEYTFAAECPRTTKPSLTDDNLDYEYPPVLHVTKGSDAGFLNMEDEDYEVAMYEEMSQ